MTMDKKELKRIKRVNRESEIEFYKNNGRPRGGEHKDKRNKFGKDRRRESKKECQDFNS